MQFIFDAPMAAHNIKQAIGISLLGSEAGNAIPYLLSSFTCLLFTDVRFVFEDLFKYRDSCIDP